MAERRLFFALWPDDRQRNQLRDAFRPLLSSIEGKIVDRRNWHVTLVFLGAFSDKLTEELKIRAAHVEVAPFRLRFDRLTYWPRPKIGCLQVTTVPDELASLKTRLESLVSAYAVAPEMHEYRPHITALRAARPFEVVRLARPIEFNWSGFELVESISVPGGVQYRPLKQ